ncbi:jg5687 [Pararge aegeria aegeria]|uniref:Jg5687 protein n=1 Tax=Pararge aegeria aegeria TaxID=348720 RepID=A0A8S4RN81_9NEOP|nr:jg5687 [Pararge aegeria aegeria]
MVSFCEKVIHLKEAAGRERESAVEAPPLRRRTGAKGGSLITSFSHLKTTATRNRSKALRCQCCMRQRSIGTSLKTRCFSGYSSRLSVGITYSPLCRACVETDETPIHVMLQCNGVAEQLAAHLGSSAILQEALGDLGGPLSFWSELGYRLAGVIERPHIQRTVQANQVRREA